MLDFKELGSRIRELRKERGLTQSEFAEKLYVSFQAVSNWERGIAPPELENLMRIASCFGILVDELLRPRAEKLILGIDGGGTKTVFVLTTLEGKVLMRLTKGASNPNDIGLQKAGEMLCDGIREVIKMFPSVSAVFCGIAGAATGDHRHALIARLKKEFPSLTVGADNDTANLFAMDELSDIAVISGTGSVIYVKHHDERIRLGGWGYLFDSAGSAYDIGREAVRVALYEEDKRLPRSKISTLLLEKLNAERIWDVIEALYKGGKPYIASMAEVVFRAYAMGDEKAIGIIDESAKRLAELLEDAVKLYHARPRAVASGGLFTNCQSIMLTHIEKYTSVKINVCEMPQVYGACLESLRMLGEDISDKFYHNFKNSYGVFEQ